MSRLLAMTVFLSLSLSALGQSGLCYANAYSGADIFASFNRAMAACGHGKVLIEPGTYNNVTTTALLSNPADCLVAVGGSGSTIINYTGSADAIDWRTTPFTTTEGGCVEGITLVGTNSGKSGIHMGDAIGWIMDDVRISGFTGTGASALWLDNQKGWTERGTISNTSLNGNTIGFRMTNSGGTVTTASFCYNQFAVNMRVDQNQMGFSTESGKLCHAALFATINGTGTSKTFISISGSGLWQDGLFHVRSEDDGAGGVRLFVGPDATLSGYIFFDNFSRGTLMTDSILGNVGIYLPHLLGAMYSPTDIPTGWYTDKEGNLQVQSSVPATATGNFNAPLVQLKSNCWTGAGNGVEAWALQNQLLTGANPSSYLTLSYSKVGCTGLPQFYVNDGVGSGILLSATGPGTTPRVRHDSNDNIVIDTGGRTASLNLNVDNNKPVNVGGQFRLGSSTFSSLGSANNGTLLYCTDCVTAPNCRGSGTGAIAKRINGSWVCN